MIEYKATIIALLSTNQIVCGNDKKKKEKKRKRPQK